jgi:hypothetical protein
MSTSNRSRRYAGANQLLVPQQPAPAWTWLISSRSRLIGTCAAAVKTRHASRTSRKTAHRVVTTGYARVFGGLMTRHCTARRRRHHAKPALQPTTPSGSRKPPASHVARYACALFSTGFRRIRHVATMKGGTTPSTPSPLDVVATSPPPLRVVRHASGYSSLRSGSRSRGLGVVGESTPHAAAPGDSPDAALSALFSGWRRGRVPGVKAPKATPTPPHQRDVIKSAQMWRQAPA